MTTRHDEAPPLLRPVASLGGWINNSLADFGVFAAFVVASCVALVTGVRAWAWWPRFSTQLYFIGARSIPVLALTGGVTGAILAIEGYDQFAALGQETRLGGVVNISIVKQIGPLLAAVMLAGRVGCSLAAELGSMRITEQIDAMRAMGADPVRVLVAPRLVACVVMIPGLTVVSNLCGITGGWLVTTRLYGVDDLAYWTFTADFVDWFDVSMGLIKSFFFGGAIALVACHKGLTCRPGAEGVGRATTEACVASFVAIVLMNLGLAKLLNDIDALRLGQV